MRIEANGNVDGLYEASMKKDITGAENKVNSENSVNNTSDIKKQDRVEISEAAAGYDELGAIKEKVVQDVQAGAGPDRLRELKAQIKDGTYFVSSADIAASIINFGKAEGTDNE